MGNNAEAIARDNAYSVVVVDDTVAVLTSLEWMLKCEGYKVHTFTQAASALLFIRSNRVHLVVSDVNMPHLDGVEFLRALRQGGWEGGFIFMSGHVAGLKNHDLKGLKVSRVIQKPFDIVEMGESISESLQGRCLSCGE